MCKRRAGRRWQRCCGAWPTSLCPTCRRGRPPDASPLAGRPSGGIFGRSGPRPAMHPVLLQIGTTVVWSHEIFVALGVAVALVASWRIARERGRADQELLLIVAGGLLGAAILARVGLAIRYLQEADAPSLLGFLGHTGRTVLGGLAGGYGGVV